MPKTRNEHTTGRYDSTVVTGQDTDGSGDITVTVPNIRRIRSLDDVEAFTPSGYTVNPQSVSGNTVTVRVFESAGSAAAHSAVTGSISIDVHVTARGATS